MRVMDTAKTSLSRLTELLSKATSDVADSLQGLRERLGELEAEKDGLLTHPLPLEEALNNLRKSVATQIERIREDRALLTALALGSPPAGIAPGQAAATGHRMDFRDWTGGAAHCSLADLTGLCPDVFAPAWEALVKAGYERPSLTIGLPGDQRARRYTEIIGEIADLEKVEEELICSARADSCSGGAPRNRAHCRRRRAR